MLNQVVLVGRLTKDITIDKVGETMIAEITLAIPKNYKNSAGEYVTSYIKVTLFDKVAQNTAEYCHKGDLIGIKGRCETERIIGERVTFLSTKRKED